jgi:hypothetical protein
MSYAFCFYFFALLEKTYRSLKSAKKYPLTANRLANVAKVGLGCPKSKKLKSLE